MATNDSYGVKLAAKLQFMLEQPRSSIGYGLTNNYYEGEFFQIGDTVKMVTANDNTVNVEFDIGTKTDTRAAEAQCNFTSDLLTVDSAAKYNIYVSDINKAEGKWDYPSLGIAKAANEIRRKHDLDIAKQAANYAPLVDSTITAASPKAVTADTIYSDVLVPIFLKLHDAGASVPGAEEPVGDNPQVAHDTQVSVYMPSSIFGLILQSKYVTDRSTVSADGVVKTGVYKECLGMRLEMEPALDQNAEEHIDIATLTPKAGALPIIAGTKNFITQASKVLPPDEFVNPSKHGKNYSGLEIFGRKIVQKKAACVFWATLEAPGA